MKIQVFLLTENREEIVKKYATYLNLYLKRLQISRMNNYKYINSCHA